MDTNTTIWAACIIVLLALIIGFVILWYKVDNLQRYRKSSPSSTQQQQNQEQFRTIYEPQRSPQPIHQQHELSQLNQLNQSNQHNQQIHEYQI